LNEGRHKHLAALAGPSVHDRRVRGDGLQ
jgi:hypothetical protein